MATSALPNTSANMIQLVVMAFTLIPPLRNSRLIASSR
jgi:hypothetical protein